MPSSKCNFKILVNTCSTFWNISLLWSRTCTGCTVSQKQNATFSLIVITELSSLWTCVSDICDAIWGNKSEVKYFAENPHWTLPGSDQWFQSYSNWKILKTIENKRNAFLFLAVSHNQCSRIRTDPTRSQHLCCSNISKIAHQNF